MDSLTKTGTQNVRSNFRFFKTASGGVIEEIVMKDKIIETQVANAPIKCLARLKDIDGGGYAMKFGWLSEDGENQEYCCWLSEAWSVKSDVNEHIVKEAGGGFYKPADFRAFVHASASLAREGAIPTLLSTSKPGWGHSFKHFSVRGYGWGNNTPTFMSRKYSSPWEADGDRNEYVRRMAEVMEKNPVVAFVCGFFAAGSLVKLCSAENFMLSLVGRTSTGKTLAIKTALSMRGNPGKFSTFDSTTNSLKETLQQSADTCLAIDEIGQSGLTNDQKEKLLYDFSQGKSRGRLTKEANEFVAKESEKSHYTAIFTGEESVTSGSHAGGAQVRVTEFIFDGKEEKLWDDISNASEAEEWERFLSANHGWLMPAVIEYIGNDLERARNLYFRTLDTLRAVADGEGLLADSAAARKLKTFALALAGSTILGEILGVELDANSAVADFALDKLRQGVATSATPDTEKYGDFIAGFSVRFADRLLGSNADQVRNVIGEVSVAGGHTALKVIATEFEKVCGRENLDMKRLLEWSAQSGALQFIMNGTGGGQGKRIFKKRMSIGGSKVLGYHFIIDNREDAIDL